MEEFQRNHLNFKESIKISDLLTTGSSFDFDTNNEDDCYNYHETDIDFTNFTGVEDNLLPMDTPFNELKSKMTQVADGVWKKIYKEAHSGHTELVDFSKHRVTYHRNFYLEHDIHPFDSTHLNGKPDIINPHETALYLEGVLDALSTMKCGEQSYFIISHTKMFKEKGCEPRVSPCADIFCDLKVVKIEEIGDQKNIEKLNDPKIKQVSFEEAKTIYNDGRLRAKNLFETKKIESAIKIYEKLVQMLELLCTYKESEIRERNEMMLQNFMNLGTCYNCLELPHKTMSIVRRIEKLCDVSSSQKFLFIKGKALRMIGEYKMAMGELEKAHKLNPKNSVVNKEMEILDKKMSEDKENMKKFSEKLFN